MQAHAQDSLQSLNQSRNQITLTGMKVLGSWGIANIAVGAAGWASASGSNKYFYQMNTFWGAVNTGVAFFGYRGALQKMKTPLNAAKTAKAQQKIETIFLINAGLDLAYIGAGAYLQNRGNHRSDDKLKGYGSSIILQGIFLAVFDATMYKLQNSNGKKWKRFLQANAFTIDKNTVGIVHTI